MFRVHEHTAKIVDTQIDGTERTEEIQSEPAGGVRRNYESSRGQTELSPQPLLHWKLKQHINSNRRCTLGQHYEYCTLWYCYTVSPLCAYKVSYRTKCAFYFNNVPFPAGYSTVRTASTCAVPGFASRRAAQVSAITALFCMWSSLLGGLDEERFLKRAHSNTEILQGSMWPLLWQDMIWYIC
jgi:hypothetical protein